ncbi:MAG: 1-deoxy-D-xylulose-5-phosphate reductoisomerase [Geminicoccaceae bacterium]
MLGATGSIGRSTLALVAEAPEHYRVEAVTAWRRVDELAATARRCGARLAVIGDDQRYRALKQALAGSGIAVAAGSAGLEEAALRPAEWVMAGIVGAAGLGPTLAAVRRGAMVALANKECLVCAGGLFMEEVRKHGAELLPVDSEHNAIWQALAGTDIANVRRLILTASGGPFRRWSPSEMAAATPAQAVAHPKWSMGAKISVDSATMMNKGLEVIEAHHLFGQPESAIEVLVHPQSIVHSLVAFKDGSLLAQLGEPDMRIPIACTLGWPARLDTAAPELDLCARSGLEFERPCDDRFPALRLARSALRQGGAAPTVLNAANEAAVAAFLGGRIGFLEIAHTVEQVLERAGTAACDDLDAVLANDALGRRLAAQVLPPVDDLAIA